MWICHVFMLGFVQVKMASRTPALCDAVVQHPAYGDAIRMAPFSAWDLDAPRNGGACHTCSSDAPRMFQAEKPQRVASSIQNAIFQCGMGHSAADPLSLLPNLCTGASVERIRFGGFLVGSGDFDAAAFGITSAEAELMDPQQRVLMEVIYFQFD